MKTRIGYYDLVWFNCEDKRIVGDMGFSFCDSADTRFPADDLQRNIESNLEYHRKESYDDAEIGDGVNEDFAIYELHTADGICEDDSPHSIACATLDMDTNRVVAVFVCATKADAESIILAHYGKDIKAYYIED